jgi:hypothetical protein
MSDVAMSSSASLKLCHMCRYKGLKGGLGEGGVGPMACGKWGSQFSIWLQSEMRLAPCTDRHHPKLGIFCI